MGTEITEREEEKRQTEARFAWENDEYDVPEETRVHPEINAEFPGILMNGDDEEWDLGLDDQD